MKDSRSALERKEKMWNMIFTTMLACIALAVATIIIVGEFARQEGQMNYYVLIPGILGLLCVAILFWSGSRIRALRNELTTTHEEYELPPHQ